MRHSRQGFLRPSADLNELLRCSPSKLDERVNDEWVEEHFGKGAWVEYPDALAATCLKIRDRHGHLAWLEPNAAQRQFALRRGRRNILLKARQLGMTTWIAARFFLATILRPGTVTLQVAHTLESAQQIFRIVHRFLRWLAPALPERAKTSHANVRELAFSEIDSRYIVETAGNPNAGRGLTIHNLHASEVAQWPGNPQDTMAALLAAVAPGGTVEIESTPKGAGGYFFTEWLRANDAVQQSPLAFTPHFFPWWIEESYQLPLLPNETLTPYSEEEMLLIERARLTPEQVKFRRHLRATFGPHAPQEYAENATECFLVSGRPVFDVAAIDARLRPLLQGSTRPPRTGANGAERVWLEPQPGRSYVIGADVAEGGEDGDFSAAVVVDAETGLQCAEILARWPIARFAQELVRLGERYNSALLAVERNNHGHAVLYALQNQFQYPRIYIHPETPAGAGSKYGWPMTARTKPQAIGALGRMLGEATDVFFSPQLLEQCRSYTYRDNGEMGALPGTHDDLVIAAAIALAVRAQGAGLQLAGIQR